MCRRCKWTCALPTSQQWSFAKRQPASHWWVLRLDKTPPTFRYRLACVHSSLQTYFLGTTPSAPHAVPGVTVHSDVQHHAPSLAISWGVPLSSHTNAPKELLNLWIVWIGTYIRWLTPRISGSRVAGVPVVGLATDQGGSAPRRAAAPVPRAGTGADGSPARTRMLSAALWSAFA